MNQHQHAKTIATRFKEIYEQSGESFSDEHYDELSLLIEAGLDTALMQQSKHISDKINELSHSIRHDSEFMQHNN